MKVAVFGGTGFVGNYIISELLNNNYEVNTLVRSGSEHKLENASKCNIINGNIDDVDSVEEVVKNSDVVIYNIGIIREFKNKDITFEKLHYNGAKLTIDLAKKYNINRYLMMSANGTCPNGTGYQITKYKAEVYLKNNIQNWTIISPSLIFGDSNGKKEFCIELKKNMLSLPFPAPAFFPGMNFLSAGKFKMSPIHVKDVAKIFVKSIEDSYAFKKCFKLGGDDYNWKEIINIISSAYGKNKLIVPAPAIGVKMAALFLDRFEWFPISADQISMLLEGNVCDSKYIFNKYNISPIEFNSKQLTYLNNE